MLNILSYQGPAGPVTDGNISAALQLMGLGMLGIFAVMLLILLVVSIMNRVTGKHGPSGRKKDN